MGHPGKTLFFTELTCSKYQRIIKFTFDAFVLLENHSAALHKDGTTEVTTNSHSLANLV